MDNIQKWTLAGVAVLVLFQLLSFFNIGSALGVGTPFIEDYDPFVKTYGINTTKDITTTGALTVSGATAISGATTLTSTFKVGSAGTLLNRVNAGTCYILAYSATIPATTTAQVDCQGTAAIYNLNNSLATALTGVTFGDRVVANLSTTTAAGTVWGSIHIAGASASTTSGYISLLLENLTGAAYTWPVTGTATGTVSYIVTN